MKTFTILLIVLLTTSSHAQEKELEDFRKELNFYMDFTRQMFDSLPVNEANQAKFRKRVDDVFKAFVLTGNSHASDKYFVDRNDPRTKFQRLDGRVTLYLTTLPVNGKTYVAYGYSSMDKRNYMIREIESNTIVHEGDSKIYSIDGLYPIDDSHSLLIENAGGADYSKTAIVLSTLKQPWKAIKGFEGQAFGQVPMEYFTTKYVKRRAGFQLNCRSSMSAGDEDMCRISFDPATKVLSYKQYSGKSAKTVTAKWENGRFLIDDYKAPETPGHDVMVPR